MKKFSLVVLVLAFVLAGACKKDKKETDDMVKEPEVKEAPVTKEKTPNKETPVTQENASTVTVDKVIVDLQSKSGSAVTGRAVFTKEEDGSVKLVALVSGLGEGAHAIHLHETSDCSSADGSSAGGHWNPLGKPHGKFGAATGYHKGDIGNFNATADGNGSITFATREWCIGCGDSAKDILGKSVVVHQGSDDFQTQPTGAAGGRLACAGIIK